MLTKSRKAQVKQPKCVQKKPNVIYKHMMITTWWQNQWINQYITLFRCQNY
jgi:hypothetical protein